MIEALPINSSLCILILNFNGSEDTLEAIQSLESQKHLIEKILILDNASSPSQRELLGKGLIEYPFCQLILSEENTGFTGGFNRLFDIATSKCHSEYLLVLNNDTIASPNLLESLLSEAQPTLILSPMILWHKDQETIIQSAGEFNLDMMKVDNLFQGQKKHAIAGKNIDIGITDGCCFLLHRKWLEQGFRFDPDFFVYFEDMDFFLRLKKAGASFRYIAKTTLYHKEYGSSGGRQQASSLRNYYFYRNRMIITQKLVPWHHRPRLYWRLIRLALQKKNAEKNTFPEASQAITTALWHFFRGIRGKSPVDLK